MPGGGGIGLPLTPREGRSGSFAGRGRRGRSVGRGRSWCRRGRPERRMRPGGAGWASRRRGRLGRRRDGSAERSGCTRARRLLVDAARGHGTLAPARCHEPGRRLLDRGGSRGRFGGRRGRGHRLDGLRRRRHGRRLGGRGRGGGGRSGLRGGARRLGGGGRGLLRGLGRLRGLRGLGGLLGLDVADEALALGLAADAIGLRILDARGMGLDPDPQRLAEVERLLVRHPELLGELVHALLGCQVPGSVLRGVSTGARCGQLATPRPSILARTGGSARFGTTPGPGGHTGWSGLSARTTSGDTGARSARLRALRSAARCTQRRDPAQSQAPRPGSVRPTSSEPSVPRTTR